jgi:hypothetical protein
MDEYADPFPLLLHGSADFWGEPVEASREYTAGKMCVICLRADPPEFTPIANGSKYCRRHAHEAKSVVRQNIQRLRRRKRMHDLERVDALALEIVPIYARVQDDR